MSIKTWFSTPRPARRGGASRLLLGVLLSIGPLLQGACSSCEAERADEGGDARPAAALERGARERASSPPRAAWARVEPGRFRMGSPPTEPCRDDDEEAVEVTLTRPLSVSRYEVTQRAFSEVMGYNPSFQGGCDACPVDSVTHHEAVAYCDALSRREGLPLCARCEGAGADARCAPTTPVAACRGYRLPTEAEWEYLARAKTKSATFAGRINSCMAHDEVGDRIAWYKASSRGVTRPVGQLTPNRWGLYDTAGNVYEWTADWYAPALAGGVDPMGPPEGRQRVLRGGSWYHNVEHARSANRYAFRPDKRLSYVGFRCVRTIEISKPAEADRPAGARPLGGR